MNTTKIKILFLIAKSRLNQSGKCSIRCRITYSQERYEFATGFFINPNHWFSKLQQAKPPNEENTFVNAQLSLIKSKINQAFLYLQVNSPDFTIDKLMSQYKGVPFKKEVGLIEVYKLYLVRIKKLVNIEIKLVTYKKYEESLTHLNDFVKWKFKSSDIKLKDIHSNFITEYEYYLKTEKRLQLSTLNKAIQRFRKVLTFAISQNYLAKDPFMLYKAKREKKEVVYLDNIELQKLENHFFEIKRVQQIKDLFIFCCYTGLGFTEMANLKKSDIIKGFDGVLWLDIRRNKTQKCYRVPLLQQARNIIEIYQNESREDVFPRLSNPKFNAYLKEVASIVGIEKNLTHHIARKTFASTVLLYNDVPMEIVSELLGHSNMVITQESYGKVVQKKVSEAMANLKDKLK
ncbi:site-specific integrase [Flavobacterium sp. LS1P28]|uniref:site-specific integrase n=1 Tax=Flavobacterium sp. LS1P28 TaxID=2497752 RepID=UPI000F829916|nr:site-specific integrase [Flavobacterium sp. LS1P28]RTY79650.1 site-specific integrase [Flavobacterium sp. LS1P28]